jgi:hypothetical protein
MQKTIDYALEEVHDRDGKHILMSLTYIGKNRGKNNGILLTRTLEQWRRNNVKSDVTTALVLNDDYLIQNIEGTRPVINEVLAKLINTYSHLLPNIVDLEEIEVRRWDGFLIKYLTSSAEDEQYTLKNFSAGADFNPYLMTKNQITNLIEDIFEKKAIIESQSDDV